MQAKPSRIKVLWVSAFTPFGVVNHAGKATFKHYFYGFLQDDRFDIRLVALADEGSQSNANESNLGSSCEVIEKDSHYLIRKMMNAESRLNPWTKRGKLISNWDAFLIMRKLNDIKNKGYVPDVIILEWTSMVCLAPEIRRVFPDARIVGDEVDVTIIGRGRKLERIHSRIARKLASIRNNRADLLEIESLKVCDLVLVQNPDNRDLIVFRGVENDRIRWLVPSYNNLSDLVYAPDGHDLLFFGAMDRMENELSVIWFIDNVMPLLSDTDAKLVVLGANPSNRLIAYASKRVIVTGFVEDITPFFTHSLCMVSPLVLGAGIKVKVLEGMLAGLPVLGNNVAMEGFHAQDRRDYLHCETPNDYESNIKDLINGRIDGRVIGSSGRKHIQDRFDFNSCLSKYRDYIAGVGEWPEAKAEKDAGNALV